MKYTFDSISLKKDGVRWFPVMGEIHYSRVSSALWKETLCKMKAGGVDIVSAYVIWIHHEEIEGQYDFTGNRSLKGFLEAAKECGVKVLLRIGPWCHGEARNGGFPDWLLKKDFEPRTNDERYFATVEKWYKKIFEQAKDYIGDEKTICGVQIENEFGHCGGLYDETGEDHMKRLQKMAVEIGFKVSIYTATGWGGARTGGMLPVMGGYCDAPWDPSTEEIEPSGNFVFTHERNDHNIGSDHGFGFGITFDINKFPYLTAELGGGLQVTQHRRTIATAKDIAAVSTVKLGSGVNLLGYYMYTGGTNPDGKLTTLQESKETGYPNDLPVKSYDFRAPIREFGQVSDTFRELKLLSSFVHQYGTELCELPAVIPESNPLDPKNLTDLRHAFRTDGSKGYAFISNYVRHQTMAEHKKVQLSSTDGKTKLPEFDVKNGEYFFVPFNIKYGTTTVKTSKATPLTALKDKIFVFYARENETCGSGFFEFDGARNDTFLVLSRKDALNSWRTSDGHLFITDSDSYVYENEKGEKVICGKKSAEFLVYPELEKVPDGWKASEKINRQQDSSLEEVVFTKYEREVSVPQLEKVEFSGSGTEYRINLEPQLSAIKGEISDCFVNLHYTGESARLYETSGSAKKLLLDNFYLGEDYPWQIGLKRFTGKDSSEIDFKNLVLEIEPLKKDAKIYIEKWPEMNGNEVALLKSVEAETEWTFKI